MPRFRRNDIFVDAIQFTGKNFFECAHFMRLGSSVIDCPELHTTDCPVVHTSDGDIGVDPGDWIIRREDGGYYSCKSYMFDSLYYPVVEPVSRKGRARRA